MASAFSGHLVDSFYTINQSRAPFGQQQAFGVGGGSTPQRRIETLATHGPMSFNPSMHGQGQPSFLLEADSTAASAMMDMSDATIMKLASLQAKLDQKLGPEYISTRAGPGGAGKLTYAEGWKIINLANEVFGFNGWSSTVVSLTTDFLDFNEESRRYCTGVTAIVRVTLRDGVFHEDIGYGSAENMKAKGALLEKAKKEAVTDGMKRALRNFGNLLGNCLYDKSYTQEITKIKVQPPKFDRNQLHRRPEFDETKPNINASASGSNIANTSTSNMNASTSYQSARPPAPANVIKSEPHVAPSSNNARSTTSAHASNQNNSNNNATNKPAPLSSVPSHMRSEVRTSTPIDKGKGKASVPVSNGILQTSSSSVQPEVNRSVSFAPPPQQASDAPGSDDSFNFGSDDDAFFAAVDLLDGDLGRPIEPEEGQGGASADVSAIGNMPPPNGPPPAGQPPNGQPPQNPPQPPNGRAGTGAAQNGSNNGMYDKTEQQRRRMAAIAEAVASSSGNASSGPGVHQNQNQGQHAGRQNASTSSRPSAPGRPPQQGPSTSRPPQNQNAQETKRASTPSMGGFHFPAGVANPHGTGSGSTKRTADMMQGEGMGLARMAQQASGRREPLGRLELDGGGDVKRMKR